MRFFQRHSLQEVGTQLGLTENAARMRLERALDKLRERMARRGITSTTTAMTVVLAKQTLSAAPVELAASIVTASVAGAATGGGLSTFTLIAMSQAKTIIVGVVIAAGLVTSLVLQHQENTRLRATLETLRSQAAERPRSQPAAQRSADADELERLRREHSELIGLRGEVTALRQRAAVTAKAQGAPEDVDRLKILKMAGEDTQGQALLAKSPEIAMLPANAWENAGFGTATAALQTLNWAVRNQDTNAFASTMSWDLQAKARAEALFAALPQSVQERYGSVDAVIFDWMLNRGTPTASYRVLSQTEQGQDDLTLAEQHQYVDGRVRQNAVQLHRDETGGWRQVIPPELLPKLEIVINDLAGMPPTGGR